MTKLDALVTIIIPIYNAMDFLSPCLQSVREQTYRNIEVILVDDKSTDDSHEVEENFKKLDQRFIVHSNKANVGASACRKLGMQLSLGEYITFLDADDYLHPQAIMKMVEGMKMADVCICSHMYDFDDKIAPSVMRSKPGLYKGRNLDEFREKMIFSIDGYDFMSVYGTLWGKMFKRSLLLQNSKYIDERLWFSEDHLYLVAILLDISSCYIIPDALYYYRQYPDQTIHHYREGFFENSVQLYYDFAELLNEKVTCVQLKESNREFFLKNIEGSIKKELIDSGKSYASNMAFLKKVCRNDTVKQLLATSDLNKFDKSCKKYLTWLRRGWLHLIYFSLKIKKRGH